MKGEEEEERGRNDKKGRKGRNIDMNTGKR